MLCAEKVGSPPSRPIARYGASDRGFPFPLHDTLRILLAKPSGQISSNAKAAARVTEHDRGPCPNPRSAFCIWNSACSSPQGRPAKSALIQNAPRTSCPLNVRRIVMAGRALHREGRQSSIAPHRTLWRARSRPAIPLHVTPHASSPPNHPTRSVRMQKPPRASRDMIAARAPIHGPPFAYGIPYVLPPRPSSQISPHTKRAAHILPSVSARGALSWPDMLCAEKVGSPPSRLIARYGAPDHALLIIHRTSMPARQSAPPSSARTTYLLRKLPLPSGNALSP